MLLEFKNERKFDILQTGMTLDSLFGNLLPEYSTGSSKPVLSSPTMISRKNGSQRRRNIFAPYRSELHQTNSTLLLCELRLQYQDGYGFEKVGRKIRFIRRQSISIIISITKEVCSRRDLVRQGRGKAIELQGLCKLIGLRRTQLSAGANRQQKGK